MANAEAKEAGAHEPKGRTKYKYITLSEAYESFPGAEVNFYGIVAEWTVPRPTRKGTDMYQVLKLRDASVSGITSTEDGGQYSDIQVQFFATSREELPKPRKKGDIIRLHRVKVGRWEGKPQLNAKIGTIMQGGMAGGFSRCQFCVFDSRVADGEENTGFEPYQRSSASFTFDSVNDKERIQGLRRYLASIGGEGALVDDTFSIPITRITMLKNYDLHVKVLDVAPASGSRPARVTFSLKQLQADPLLETLDTIMPVAMPEPSVDEDELMDTPLPGLTDICSNLLTEEGIDAVIPGRQAVEQRVVSQDLELWLTNVVVEDGYNLLARAGRQVQEIHVVTGLDRDAIKRAIKRATNGLK